MDTAEQPFSPELRALKLKGLNRWAARFLETVFVEIMNHEADEAGEAAVICAAVSHVLEVFEEMRTA